MHWSREPARLAKPRAAALTVWSFASSAALAGAKHVSNGWCGLQGIAKRQAECLEITLSRLKGEWQTWKTGRSQSIEIKALGGAIKVATFGQKFEPADVAQRGNGSTNLAQGDAGGVFSRVWEEGAQLRLESALETAKSKLALIESASRPIPATSATAQLDEPTTSS